MPTNKAAALRHRILDELLQNRRGYTLDQLRERITERLDLASLGVRTLKGDLSYLRHEFDAPIACRQGRYAYQDPAFSIFQGGLSAAEAEALARTRGLLAQFRELPHGQEIAEILEKVAQRIRYQPPHAASVVEFARNESATGVRWLGPLYAAIRDQQPLRLTYTPFGRATEALRVHPYYLKEYNQRWFLLAYDEARQDISVLGLDRIGAIAEYLVAFRPDTRDWKDYFAEVIGVTVPREVPVETVRLRFRRARGHYVVTKPLHASQVVVAETEAHITLEIRVRHNPELESRLLSFGHDVQVLAPEALAATLRELLAKAAAAYEA